jgi:ABC-type histidine transport system ATPase subunit
VGEILVERTVAEVIPAVKGNKEQLDAVRFYASFVSRLSSIHMFLLTDAMMTHEQVVERLVKQLETKKKELSDFQEKYKIRIRVRIRQEFFGCFIVHTDQDSASQAD